MDWKSTQLAEVIWNRCNTDLERKVIEHFLPDIEELLRSGSPASKDFTLHDDRHGRRVAEMISNLLGDIVPRLSGIEITLLLFASYCHDIGMSPAQDKIKRLRAYLLTNDSSLLTAVEADDLQSWLDTNRDGITPPIAGSELTVSGIDAVDDIVAYYSRSKHNDWSEDFIRETLSSSDVSLYPGWIDELVTLCRSHHEGLYQLKQDRFNSKIVGKAGSPLNLRFLAATLRLADVLEFSPERTPSVVLNQRDIAPGSRIYWFKDHSISFTLDSQHRRLMLSAQTPSAYIHKAVLDTVDQVNAEMEVCSILEQDGAYLRGIIKSEDRITYSWPWASRLVTDVREISGTFSYIDGRFRPDSSRILDLLSGTALYKRPIVAVRELVQNSCDAVREQIAYARLESGNPLNAAVVDGLSRMNRIGLTFFKDGDRFWLRCTDSGVGMTRAIIARKVLVSGASAGGDIRRLERQAKEAGFSVERTGRFGIGVLSYFMLADTINIVTRRSQEAGDFDTSAWRFTINGLEGFGELTTESRATRGTDVALRLLPDVVGVDPARWFSELVDYLKETFRWVPCSLTIRSDVDQGQQLEVGPGWTSSPSDGSANMIKALFRASSSGSDIQTNAEQLRAENRARQKLSMEQEALERLRWTAELETPINDGAGTIRAAKPYFDLDGGPCSIFLHVSNDKSLKHWGRGSIFRPSGQSNTSLHGIRVENTVQAPPNFLDINITGGANISVDRTKLLNTEKRSFVKSVRRVSRDLEEGFLRETRDSLFNEINIAVSNLDVSRRSRYVRSKIYWPVMPIDGKEPKIEIIEKPIVSVARISYRLYQNYRFYTESTDLEASFFQFENHGQVVALHDLIGGGAIAGLNFERSYSGIVGIQWKGDDDIRKLDGTVATASSAFPPEWKDVVAIVSQNRPIFNQDNRIVRMSGSHIFDWNPNLSAEEIEGDLEKAATSAENARKFFIDRVRLRQKHWIWMHENFPNALNNVVDLANENKSDPLVIIRAIDLSEDQSKFDISSIAAGKDGFTSLSKVHSEWELRVNDTDLSS